MKRIPVAGGFGRRFERCGRRAAAGEPSLAARLAAGAPCRTGGRDRQRRAIFLVRRRGHLSRARRAGRAIAPGCGRCILSSFKPPIGLSTADVYRAYDALDQSAARRRIRALESSCSKHSADYGVHELGGWMHNRLQAAAASLSPWVERLRAAFDQLDFLGHQLSGSGSAYFGVCRHAQHARRLAQYLRTRQLGLVYVTRSCT